MPPRPLGVRARDRESAESGRAEPDLFRASDLGPGAAGAGAEECPDPSRDPSCKENIRNPIFGDPSRRGKVPVQPYLVAADDELHRALVQKLSFPSIFGRNGRTRTLTYTLLIYLLYKYKFNYNQIYIFPF